MPKKKPTDKEHKFEKPQNISPVCVLSGLYVCTTISPPTMLRQCWCGKSKRTNSAAVPPGCEGLFEFFLHFAHKTGCSVFVCSFLIGGQTEREIFTEMICY